MLVYVYHLYQYICQIFCQHNIYISICATYGTWVCIVPQPYFSISKLSCRLYTQIFKQVCFPVNFHMQSIPSPAVPTVLQSAISLAVHPFLFIFTKDRFTLFVQGLLSHTFPPCVHTEYHIQVGISPVAKCEISIFTEPTSGHLHQLLTDVPLASHLQAQVPRAQL